MICPVCDSENVVSLIDIAQVPVYCNRLWPTREEAMAAPRGDISLGYCDGCGHIFNTAFNSDLMAYDQEYENSLHFSPRFQAYAESLAQRLVRKYGIYQKHVIEIGCGKGDFLEMLCRLGDNHGLGFDPSFEIDRGEGRISDQFRVINDYYSEKYQDCTADLICCRHVLEHIRAPKDFLEMVHSTLSSGSETIVFFEVPDVMYTLNDLGIWDLIYEHCGYFNAASLRYLFKRCGFRILRTQTGFEGQFLCIDATPDKKQEILNLTADENKNAIGGVVDAFAGKYKEKIILWKAELERIKLEGQNAVVWGGGSKGVTFLNVLQLFEEIEHVVDINPHKNGRFVPGTGQQIISPEYLSEVRPDVIIVMNSNYLPEIKHSVDALNISPIYLVV